MFLIVVAKIILQVMTVGLARLLRLGVNNNHHVPGKDMRVGFFVCRVFRVEAKSRGFAGLQAKRSWHMDTVRDVCPTALLPKTNCNE
jgi:hypothetical protein